MDKEERIAGCLGLAARARQVSSGEFAVLELIRKGRASIVLADEELGVNTRKKIENACKAHGVPLCRMSAGRLARAIGGDGKKVAAMAASGLADKIKEIIT
ncbi:MAG: ribosomal L7Ae/L30e/S12e/Gadd45 family protein [Oscillospiraceae bacterium]|jgi:ribosomal protein L7Ae-like RNA K-turn-binding protein|nr:ribosomal L7Ae/L30e/S12e/Gadd45 family protein [Oscillospiraceae bacterium]